MLGGSKKGNTSPQWWDEQVEIPREGMPSTKKMRRKVRFHRRFIIVALILFPVVLLANVVLVSNQFGTEDETSAYVGPPPTQADAIVAANLWLNTNPSPLPGGSVVSWNSYRETPLPPPTETDASGGNGLEAIEVHELTVASASGVQYLLTVQLAVGESIGAIPMGTPSLSPLPPVARGVTAGLSPWPTLDETPTPEGVDTAIDVWLAAYTSGDPALLLNTVGDSRRNVSYVPFTGLSLDIDSVSIVKSAALWTEDERTNAATEPSRIVVQIKVSGYWPGTVLDSSSQLPEFTFDLLVNGANTASPRVVAWGGAGQGVWLEPYSNAVAGKVISADELPRIPNEENHTSPTQSPATDGLDPEDDLNEDVAVN